MNRLQGLMHTGMLACCLFAASQSRAENTAGASERTHVDDNIAAQAKRPLFARSEPHLAAGHAAINASDFAAAIGHYRDATADNVNARAIVEYDVAQALLLEAQHTQATQATPSAEGGQAPLDVTEAKNGFDRAFGMATAPSLKSEAALASGNASALAGDLDAAIAAYRKAIVADAKNTRAKNNLRRVLDAKRKQEEQQKDQQKDQPKDGGGEPNNDDKKPEQGEDQPQDPGKDQGNNAPQNGEQEQKPQPQQKGGDDDKKPGDDKKPEGTAPAPSPGAQKKSDAKRLLDALSGREQPLSPMQMRGTRAERPKNGKDW